MRTKHKIIIAIIVSFAISLIGILIFQNLSKRQNNLIAKMQKKEHRDILSSVMVIRADFLARITKDYSCYDDMILFAQKPDEEWAKENITVIPNFAIQAIWIYNRKHDLIYSDFDSTITKPLIIKDIQFADFHKKRTIHFFKQTQYGLMEIAGSTIHTSEDTYRKDEPQGFLIIGKIWDSQLMREICDLSKSAVRIETDSTETKNTKEIIVPLKNYKGNTVSYLMAYKDNPFISRLSLLSVYSTILLVVFTAIILIIFTFTFNRLVIKPLRNIERALSNDNIKPVEAYTTQLDEFGEISRLILAFFQQRTQLKDEIQERIQTEQALRLLTAELNQQKEEIEAQRDNLDDLNKELNVRNVEIAAHHNVIQDKNTHLELQNEEIKRQKTEIIDSIIYARRIQTAVLPADNLLKDLLYRYFILYRPRDIVSGDFYWARRIDNKVFIAVADCMGHGVPGAFMSMLGIAFLSEIVSYNELKANEILNLLRERVMQSLHDSSDASMSNEGMDIALCIIDYQTNYIQYAGAYNPVFAFHKQEFIKLTADSMPVSAGIKQDKTFTNKELTLDSGDMLYLFTDGYVDQFGGELGRKFLTTNFRQLLASVCHLPVDQQKDIMESTLDKWKGDNPQVDDILVLGIQM